jgi:transposase
MRGRKAAQTNFVCFVNVESRIPEGHPIRKVKKLIGEVFERLDPEFEDLYAQSGRASIPPERLLAAKVLMALYTVRSDRQFCERLQYDLLFQWFLDLNPDEKTFDASTFSKNQERLLEHHVSELFFAAVVDIAREEGWVSNEHFSADGTLIEAWASMKSFRPKDDQQSPGSGNGWMDFKGEKRSNETHQSTTDPEANLLKKGKGREAKLCFGAHAIMENRNGLCVHIVAHPSEGVTEGEAGLDQIEDLRTRGFGIRTVGGDKGYHTDQFVRGCREGGIKPHVAEVSGRKVEGLDGRTTNSKGYAKSLVIRRRIEELFGWMKTVGGLRKSRYRGVERTNMAVQFCAAASNLLRMAKLAVSGPPVTEVVGA